MQNVLDPYELKYNHRHSGMWERAAFKNTRGWNGPSLKLHGIIFDEFLGLLLAERQGEMGGGGKG